MGGYDCTDIKEIENIQQEDRQDCFDPDFALAECLKDGADSTLEEVHKPEVTETKSEGLTEEEIASNKNVQNQEFYNFLRKYQK